LAKKRRKQVELFEEEFDPFAVTPEDALDAARREVKTWRLNQLTHMRSRADLDPTTSWFVLAWDAFKAPVFAYDEGLRLARAVGADLDGHLIGRICEKKGSDIKLWDSKTRAEKGALGGADGARSMLDALHHAAHRARTASVTSCRALHRMSLGRRWIPHELVPIIDWPIKIEFLPELDLPLLADGFRCKDDGAFYSACKPSLPQQHARLDSLPKTDLIRDEKLRWPMFV
jgi:hypothetical protein